MIISLVIKGALVLIDLLLLGLTLGDVAPPVDVQATQASVSGPVEISWVSPASSSTCCNTSDLTNITGYRIFFNNGESILLPLIITSVGVLSDGIAVGQQISIRSEAEQKQFSELVNVTIGRSGSNNGSGPNEKAAAIALGVILVFVLGFASTLVTLLLLNRLNNCNCKAQSTMSLRRSYYRLRKHFVFRDPNTSDNVAYGSVNIKPSESTSELVIEAGTEDGSGQDAQPHPTYENVNYSELVD